MPDYNIALPVYGSVDVKVTSKMKKEVQEAKKDWKYDCPSFEVWIAMTKYDPGKEDGGPVFQQMLHYLLVQGAYSINTDFVTSYFAFDDGDKVKTGIVQGRVRRVKPANKAFYYVGKRERYFIIQIICINESEYFS